MNENPGSPAKRGFRTLLIYAFVVNALSACKAPSQYDLSYEVCRYARTLPAAFDQEAPDEIRNRYGQVCNGLAELQGLKFRESTATYSCNIQWKNTYDPDLRNPDKQRFARAFGLAALNEVASGRDRMAFAGGENFQSFIVLILTKPNQDDRVLTTKSKLHENLQRVTVWQGAATVALLDQTISDEASSASLCGGTVSETANGWLFEDVIEYRECRSKKLMKVDVRKDGRSSVIESNYMPGEQSAGCS